MPRKIYTKTSRSFQGACAIKISHAGQLQDHINSYAILCEELNIHLSKIEDISSPYSDADAEALMDCLRSREKQGEVLVHSIVAAMRSGENLPHSAKNLLKLADEVLADTEKDGAFASHLWQLGYC